MEKIDRAKSKHIWVNRVVPLKDNRKVCYICILLKLSSQLFLLYQNALLFFLLSFQCTLKRKSYWLRGKTLPKMDRPSSSNPAIKSLRQEPISAPYCWIHLPYYSPLLPHSFFDLPGQAETTYCSPGILQTFSTEAAEAATPGDWAATGCEASPEYRQPLLHSPTHIVYTNLLYSFVTYIHATGSLSLENLTDIPSHHELKVFISYIISTAICCIISTQAILPHNHRSKPWAIMFPPQKIK